MTIKEIIEDSVNHIYVSKDADGDWWARIDDIPNPALGATRFPFSFEESGRTRGEAIRNLYAKMQGQALGLLKSELKTN